MLAVDLKDFVCPKERCLTVSRVNRLSLTVESIEGFVATFVRENEMVSPLGFVFRTHREVKEILCSQGAFGNYALHSPLVPPLAQGLQLESF